MLKIFVKTKNLQFMSKKFSKFINDFFKNLMINFIESGNVIIDNELKVNLIENIDKLSCSNEDMNLTDDGLVFRSSVFVIEINLKKNYLDLNGSKVFLSREEINELYNKILKNSFIGY